MNQHALQAAAARLVKSRRVDSAVGYFKDRDGADDIVVAGALSQLAHSTLLDEITDPTILALAVWALQQVDWLTIAREEFK
jgi:hypothetical protein